MDNVENRIIVSPEGPNFEGRPREEPCYGPPDILILFGYTTDKTYLKALLQYAGEYVSMAVTLALSISIAPTECLVVTCNQRTICRPDPRASCRISFRRSSTFGPYPRRS